MSPITITLLILLGAIVLFITELVPLGITPLIVLSSLAVFRILPTKEILAGFSNDTTILVLFMCPVGEALFRTGVCSWIGKKTIKLAGHHETKLIGLIMMSAAFVSAFSSNTGTAIVMTPMIISIANEASVSASRLLLPLAYGASFGGMLTLIGTPPNIIVQGALSESSGQLFGFFDFAKVSLPVVILSVLYMMFIGKKQVAARLPIKPKAAGESLYREGKMKLALFIVVLVVAGMFFERQLSDFGLSLPIIAIIGAVLTVITGCITMKEFTGSIEWTAILLMGGMQPLGLAMQKTGTADLLADSLTRILADQTPFMLTAAVLLFAGIVAQFMSHTAATSILAPVCVAMALKLNVSPAPLLMALCQATSIAVATPIGTPPNVIVYQKGGYKFQDFVVTGVPLFIIGVLVLAFLIPRVFPF